MNKLPSRLAPAVVLCLPLLALAQAGPVDPSDSKASAPTLRYRSAFADYRPWQDTKPGDWRAANDKVRDAAAKGSGHAGHATPATPPAAASAPGSNASGSAVSGHGGHHMHGGKQ
jgi:hypothetical protein